MRVRPLPPALLAAAVGGLLLAPATAATAAPAPPRVTLTVPDVSPGDDTLVDVTGLHIDDRGLVTGTIALDAAPFANTLFSWRAGVTTPLAIPGRQGDVRDTNAAGLIVGSTESDPDGTTAVLWRAGVPELIQPAGTAGTSASAVTDRGDVLLEWSTAGGRSFGWWRNGRLRSTASLAGLGADGRVTGADERRRVVGYRARTDGARVGFVWRDGTFTDLLPAGWDGSAADDVSTTGGYVDGLVTRDAPDPAALPFVARHGRVTVLPLPAGIAQPFFASVNHSVNDRGSVVAVGRSAGPRERCVLWRDRTPVVLPDLGGDRCAPAAINDRDQVVGQVFGPDGAGLPVLWDRGRLVPLPLGPGNVAGSALDINDRGQIVGTVLSDEAVGRLAVWTLTRR